MEIADLIIKWYHRHKRDLPWRNTTDPYRIWVSEVILQQTRVEQGRAYYNLFLKKFPDVFSLAAATEQEVLLVWQGLGYYSRARNMHQAARQVVGNFGGVFPEDYNTLLSLKGVGSYTAAAIASFAYRKPHPAVDGNVNRVMARLFDIKEPVNSAGGGKIVQQGVDAVFPHDRPDIFNQALMEFGALQCVPRQPDCSVCPLKKQCQAYENNTVHLRPVKKKKRAPAKRYLNYLVINHRKSDKLYVTKRRNPRDIWFNLYEFPLIESNSPLTPQQLTETTPLRELLGGNEFVIRNIPRPVKHQLSHQTLFVFFWKITIEAGDDNLLDDEAIKTAFHKLGEYPFPRLISAYVEENAGEYQKNRGR